MLRDSAGTGGIFSHAHFLPLTVPPFQFRRYNIHRRAGQCDYEGYDELGTAGEGRWIDQHCCIGLLFSFCQCFCGGGMDLPRASRHSIYFSGSALIVEYPVGQIFKDWRLVLPRIR